MFVSSSTIFSLFLCLHWGSNAGLLLSTGIIGIGSILLIVTSGSRDMFLIYLGEPH
jgi:hypothetical protein